MNQPLLSAARSAARLGLLALSGAATLAAQTSPAPANNEPKKDEQVKLEKFEITGSRIKRIDVETPSPVTRFTSAELQMTGFTTVDDALRALPFNNGFSIVPEGSGTGFASGTSTVNLRGLGNNNTLVLINGRRAVPSGAGAFNGFQSVIDLRMIPSSAVESVEILRDGASAIYGSDAVAGVVAVNLKRDYTGVGTTVSFGNTVGTDSMEKSAYLIAGATAGKTNITTSVSYNKRNAIRNFDFDFSKSADKRIDKTTNSQVELNSAGYLTGVDWRSTSTFPARFFVPGTNTILSYVNPTSNPTAATAAPISRATGSGFYDYQKDSFLLPEIEFRGFSTYVKHQFTPTLYGFADVMYSRVNTINASAPAPFTTTDRGAGRANRLVVPANNPFNPYGARATGGPGQEIELSTFRTVNVGPRYSDITSDFPRAVFGLGGDIPGTSWTWQAGYMWAQGTFDNTSPGTAFDSQVQQALRGVVIDGTTLYANPFGPEDPRITDYYSGNNPTNTKFTGNVYDVSAGGDLFDVRAGKVGLAVGAEYRTEQLLDVRTTDNETGNVVGGSEGFGFYGERKVTSFYAELKVPVTKQVEVQLAGRHEDYSDFGTTLKPKVAVAYRPTKWLMLRGSFSQSFKAPDLAFLLSKGSVSFTGNLFDPRRTDLPSAQIRTLGRGTLAAGYALKPEEADTWYGGFLLEVPKGKLKDLALEVGYFRFDQTNLITRDSATFTLANELRLPPTSVVRKSLTPEEVAAGITVGQIDFIATDWFNSNKALNEGIDISLRYPFKTQRFGNFRFGVEATYLSKYHQDRLSSLGAITKLDIDHTEGVPIWRGNGTIAWNKGPWGASIFINYIGSMPTTSIAGTPQPQLNPFIRVNPQVSYRGLWRSTLTVGVRNALNEKPPYYANSPGDAYLSGVHSPEPAFWYVRLAREF